MKKKIVVSGASGFIGTALVKHLHKKYSIIGIDRRTNTYPKGVKFYNMDINNGLPDIDDVYCVIHLAANPGVRDSYENFEQVCIDNIYGTHSVLDKCISDWKPERILLASSSSVYGDLGRDGHALKEDDGVAPRSPYAMSKVANESLVETYQNCGLLDGINTTCMRFFTVYGPNQRNELAIRAFTDWILRDEPITLYGKGQQVRDYTHIDDIVSGIEALMNIPKNIHYRSAYNIGSGDARSINEIIHLICKYTGKNVTINYQPRDRYDVDRTLADNNRLQSDSDFGGVECYWKPKIKFEEGLKEQILWQKSLM